jgi:hypothetical protein
MTVKQLRERLEHAPPDAAVTLGLTSFDLEKVLVVHSECLQDEDERADGKPNEEITELELHFEEEAS